MNQLPPAVKTVLSSDTAGGMTSSSLATLTSVDPLDNQGQTMRAKTPPKTPPQTPPQTPLRIVLAIQEPEESGSQEPQDPLLLPISSEASPTWDPCERRKKIEFLICRRGDFVDGIFVSFYSLYSRQFHGRWTCNA